MIRGRSRVWLKSLALDASILKTNAARKRSMVESAPTSLPRRFK